MNAMSTGSNSIAPAPVIPQRAYATGMWLALAGILMFFTALVSAWVVRRGLSTSAFEAPLDLPRGLLAFNTAVLVASSATLEVSRKRFKAGLSGQFRRFWRISAGLGVTFVALQVVIWHILEGQGVYLASNPDASFFYLFTASHAIHLAGGIAALFIVAAKPLRQLTFATAVRVSAMYWHFLTLVWIGLFALLTVASH
jgi:cytochrome c oxidase subunit III